MPYTIDLQKCRETVGGAAAYLENPNGEPITATIRDLTEKLWDIHRVLGVEIEQRERAT